MSVKISVKENNYNLNLDDLIVLGKRINNSKRNFLFISKIIGKHIEVKPNVCKEFGEKLAMLFYSSEEKKKANKMKKNICVLGFAETATGIGMSVASYIMDSYYITTTREEITEFKSILKFEEEHSHATTHKCFPLDSDGFINADKIVLVDDELTTGKSMINIIKELKRTTNARDFIVLSILDWRNKEYRQAFDNLKIEEDIEVDVLALISGDIEINDNRVYIDNDDTILEDYIDIIESNVLERITLKTKLNSNGESYLKNTGRFGVKFSDIEKLEDQCKEVAGEIQEYIGVNKKILVLGHGENIYIPCRIASYLQGNIYFKSTTRSPIYCENIDGYPIKEKHTFFHKDVKYYFYNKTEIEENYDKVVLITEDDLNVKLTNNMIAVRI